jgi:hypothetical protein
VITEITFEHFDCPIYFVWTTYIDSLSLAYSLVNELYAALSPVPLTH